ncbi:ribonuclease H-like domain-containing protein [Tanacetum coccineum]
MTKPDVKNAKPRQDANATGNYTEALLLKLLGRLGVKDTVDNDTATGNASSHVNTHIVHPVAYHTNLEGVDVDETFSPVVKPDTIWTVLSLAVSRHWLIHLLDVKNAFLHVDLSETVYMHQPPCFWDSKYPDHKYVVEILKMAHMVNCNSSRTPVDTESKLGDDGAPQVCLYMHDPREPHFLALKRILRYVWGTLDYGLQLFPSSNTSLIAYSDADWAACPTTQRSTSGYCIFLGNNLLSCSSKCQPTLSRSSADAEYRGVTNAVVETCWLRNLLRELHTPLSFATLVYCDNVTAVYLSCNMVHHQRTKHIEIDIHFVRDLVTTGQDVGVRLFFVITVDDVSSQDAYAFERYSQLCAMDTIVCFQSPSSNTVITNNIRNVQSISNNSIATAVAINEGQSSGAGHQTCVIQHNVNADENANS